MRGKVAIKGYADEIEGITPAHAGKSILSGVIPLS